MKLSFPLIIAIGLIGSSCIAQNKQATGDSPGKTVSPLPYLTFQKEYLFPGDSSLSRPEDGVALADGRVIVVDQAKGLRIIEKDGTNRPFGHFSEVGFVHNPPAIIAGPNGMFLEHDQKHVLMCDFGDGKIYQINLATQKVTLIYYHSFGVNAVYRDKTGAIWFSQSASNTDMTMNAINSTTPQGAIFRLADMKSVPTKVADSLYFANGITMDREEKTLFVAETLMNRVLSFEVDINRGELKPLGVAAIVIAPDNLLVDRNGRLIIASPGASQVTAVDFKNHSQQLIFDASTPDSRKLTDEWFRRSQLGLKRADLVTSKMYRPLPSLLTGMFFSQDGQTLYITNLGNSILKMAFK